MKASLFGSVTGALGLDIHELMVADTGFGKLAAEVSERGLFVSKMLRCGARAFNSSVM